MTGLEFRRPDEPQIKIESFWFDVYHGGKPVATRDLGLTVDEVVVDTNRIGCGGKARAERPATGDVDGDGYPDATWWGECPEGTCFWQETRARSGADAKREVGDGGWFSAETDRLGLGSGDLDGDGLDDLVYRGRCAGSRPCWRVHLETPRGISGGRDWGDGARLDSSAQQLVLGDFDGDGRDDMTYLGYCGEDSHRCWRTHLSDGAQFTDPRDWGPHRGPIGDVLIGDVDGDGTDDLVYRSDCEGEPCWFSQLATTGGFEAPHYMGPAETELDRRVRLIDFDDDGHSDLVSWGGAQPSRDVTVRILGDTGFADPTVAAVFDSPVSELHLRKLSPSAPVQAIAHLACGELTTCIEYRVAVTGRALTSPRRPTLTGMWVPQVI
jgi:hypothetical protein